MWSESCRRFMRSRHASVGDGIGLVDLMVGLVIGMAAMLVILKVAVLFDARRRSTTGMADAQLNAASAIMLMSRELRMAGQGLGQPDTLGCDVRHDRQQLGALTLAPVQIIDGANGTPDRIRVLSSGSAQSVSPARLISDHPDTASTMMVDSTLGMSVGDYLLLHATDVRCALLRATSIPLGGYRVDHVLPAAGSVPGYPSGTPVINVGRLHYVEFSIDANRYLQVARYSAQVDQWQNAALASEVVSLQAQYGFDTQPGTPAVTKVTRWSSALLDVDGNGTVGDNGDLRRMIAVRLAIVVRSVERSDQGCHAVLPQWMAGDDLDGQLKLTDIRLIDLSQTGNHSQDLPDWQCFRYRVLQTEIPLRNLLWSES